MLIVERQKEAMNVAEMNEVENYSNAKIKIVKDKDYDPLLFWSNNESQTLHHVFKIRLSCIYIYFCTLLHVSTCISISSTMYYHLT